MNDLRFALRSLRKSRTFVLVAALCLGTALALNTTTFAILDAMLHPSLPVQDADRLFEVAMWGYGPGAGAPMSEKLAVLRSATFYEDLAMFSWGRLALVRAGDHAEQEWVPRVSPNLFRMLGVRPELGHLIEPGSPDNLALISHEEWERAFGGRPLDGLTIWVGDRQYQVVGVLPPDMKLRNGGPQEDVWIPAPAGWIPRGRYGDHVVLKLKRGWTRAAASEQLRVLAQRLTLEYGSGPVPYAFSLSSIMPDPLHLRPIHLAMAGAAFLVLLIACVNLASLMLVRGIVKRRELALRMAIGAGRGTLIRQLFAESALVAIVGAALGVVLTAWAIALLYHHMPPSVAALNIERPHASWRVFVAGLGLVSATLVLFGLWPAIRASDVDVSEPLKENSPAATGGQRGRYSLLVIAEVALSLVLLMGAALLARAAERRADAMSGLDRTGLLDARVWLNAPDSSLPQAAHDLEERVAAVPGVRSVATYGYGGNTAMSEAYDGQHGLLNHTSVLRAGAGFLETLGIPVVRGRGFLPGDERGAVAIVDEAAARWLWPDGRAVGRQVKLGGPTSDGPWYRVVGIARAAPAAGVSSDPFLTDQGTIYVAWQPQGRAGVGGMAIRIVPDDPATGVAVRQAMDDALRPRGGLLWVRPWLWRFDAAMRARYFLIKVFGSFSAFALLLAAIGLYGVVSYSVSQRMREFAVRIAVGAPAREVMKLVAHDATVMILAGTGLGAFVAMWASGLLGDWLYSVPHTDAVALVTAEVVLLLAGLAAGLQPALRAIRANPVEILRAI